MLTRQCRPQRRSPVPRVVLIAATVALAGVVVYLLVGRGNETSTAACLDAKAGRLGVSDSVLRATLNGVLPNTDVLRYVAVNPYGYPIEVVLARASNAHAAAQIIRRASAMTVVASRNGRVAILSTRPLDPDTEVTITNCLAKHTWS